MFRYYVLYYERCIFFIYTKNIQYSVEKTILKLIIHIYINEFNEIRGYNLFL